MEVMSGFYWDSGKKEINQDSVLVEQVNTGKGRILLAAVSDGIGGLPAGEVASGFLMERLQQHFYEEILPLIRKGKSSKKIRHSFFRCLYETVGMLQKYADSREISLGATLSVLLLMKRRYLILHVGDSRIYEIRKKRIRQLTEDHRGEGNILTRCMGSFPMSEVCSDGFWGRAAEELLREMLDPSEILTEEQIQKRLSEIGSYGKRQGERDNLSAIYVLLKREEEGFEGNSLQ